MELQVWLLIGIILAAIVLFLTESFSPDVVVLLVAAALILTGLVSIPEGLSGFSHQATITVAAFFVITRAFRNTGLPTLAAQRLVRRVGHHSRRFLAALMPLSALSASFLHVTGVVAVYLPIVLDAARSLKEAPSRFLIPLSYSAQFGGVCTLLGTTSNLVVSSIMAQKGLQPVGMFEVTKLGVPLFVVGFIYLMTVGWKILPSRQMRTDLKEEYGLEPYLAELIVSPSSRLKGKTLEQSELGSKEGIHVVEILRGHQSVWNPSSQEVLQAGDVLRTQASLEGLVHAAERLGLELPPPVRVDDGRLATVPTRLVEVLLAPGSSLEGKTLRESRFRERTGVSVLAIKRREPIPLTDMADIRLRANDRLLLQGTRRDFRRLQQEPDFIFLSRVQTPRLRRRQVAVVMAALAAVVICTTFHIVPIVLSSLVAAVALVALGAVSDKEAYESIEWRVVCLIAGVIPLGLAAEKWGLAPALGEFVTGLAGNNPWLLLSAVYFATMIVTEFVTHVACAVIMTPVAMAIATSAGLDPRPFCIAVIFATDTSFSTPVGYQSNAMIFNVGGYRFSDFPKIGIPLNLLFWLLSSILIPIIWPLKPLS